jgi:hypothetical protein
MVRGFDRFERAARFDQSTENGDLSRQRDRPIFEHRRDRVMFARSRGGRVTRA